MAAKQMDALGSFVYLLDNVDKWSTTIRDLSSHVEKKHADFAAEYTRLVQHARPKRVKSPSIASIQSKDEGQGVIPVANSTTTEPSQILNPVEINPFEAGNRYLFAQTQKKRKPDGSIRSGASGPQKFRSKHQVVIYYDSEVQEELDKMFKSIVLARNNLRKGKNALTSSMGFQLPNIRQRFDSPFIQRPDPKVKEPTASQASATAFAGAKPRVPEISQVVMNDHEIAIAQTDKNLESIQTLCETAAHQFLRDGDCKTELDGIIRRFDAVLAQAKLTAEGLQKEKDEKEAMEVSSSDISIQSRENTSNTGSESTLCTKPSLEAAQLVAGVKREFNLLSDKAYPKIQAPVITSLRPNAGLATLEIEIDDDDDDDDDDIELDLSKYRVYTTRALRAT